MGAEQVETGFCIRISGSDTLFETPVKFLNGYQEAGG